MRFEEFLNEKVTKAEINEIFKDDSVLIGAEFEFFLPEMAKKYLPDLTINGYTIDEVRAAYNKFVKELDEWVDNIEMEEQKINIKIDNLELEKKEIEEYEEKDYEKLFKKDPKKLIDKIDDKIDELQDGMIEVINLYDPPVFPSALDAMNDIVGRYGQSEIRNFPYIEYLENPNKMKLKLAELWPNDDFFEFHEDSSDDFFEAVASELEDIEEIKNVRINESPDLNSNWWGLVTDDSVPISKGGLELISPPIPLPKFIKICPKIFEFISINGETSSKTGFHVGISLKNINLHKEMDVIKLLSFHDEELVYHHFDERKGSKYALSIKDKLKTGDIDKKDLYKIFNMEKINKEISGGKFYGINLDKIASNYIEFRYMGGDDYEDKWKSIKTLIGNHAFNLKLACDPSFKRKEYVKKLIRHIEKSQEKHIWKYVTIVMGIYFIDILKERYENNKTINDITYHFEDMIERCCFLVSPTFNKKRAIQNFKSLDVEEIEQILSKQLKWYFTNLNREDKKLIEPIIDELRKMSAKKFKLEVLKRFK